jgi:RNA recognition motif-containing protein
MNKQLLGFKKVDIQFKLTKLNSTERVMHSIFIKKHSSRSEEFPSGKTLFIVNIPVDFSQQALTTMFAELGEIVKVKFQVQKKTGTSCHVIFKDSESVDMILEDFDGFDASTLTPLTNDIGLSSELFGNFRIPKLTAATRHQQFERNG